MNLRHGARVNIRLTLEVIQATRRCLGLDVETCLIFAGILAGNASAVEESPDFSRRYASAPVPDDLRRPMRVQRLAESLSLPRETTRAKVTTMIGEGLVEQTGEGLIVPAATLASPRLISMSVDHMAALEIAVERLARAGCAELTSGERLAARPFPSMWGAMRTLTQHVLRGVVELRGFAPPMSLLQAYLMLAILDRSAWRMSSGDTILYARHDDPPPPSAHALVSAQGLATFLDLPRETVRRNMHALVRDGSLVQDPEGYAISPSVRVIGSSGERRLLERTNADLARLVRKIRNIGALTTA